MLKYLDEIEEQIRSERCVIMLGPNALVDEGGTPLHTRFQQQVQQEQDMDLSQNSEGLLQFKRPIDRVTYATSLKRFYASNQAPDKLHQQLARIPCHLLVSTTPDLRFRKAFEQLDIDPQYEFYNKKQPKAIDLRVPTAKDPLLYNLFGSIQDTDSLVFTFQDQSEYLIQILGDNRPPKVLLQAIKQASFFLFLGFDFDKWYLALLLRFLGFQRDCASLASGHTANGFQRFYESHFDVMFVEDDISEYVDALYERFRQKGLLRTEPEATANPFARQIRSLLREDELEEALDVLEEYCEEQDDQELSNTATQLMGRMKGLKRNKRKGVLDHQEAEIERNKIKDAVMDMASEL